MIAAEGEQKASRALKEAAAVINESPSALQVDHGDDEDNSGGGGGGGGGGDDDFDDDDDASMMQIMIS